MFYRVFDQGLQHHHRHPHRQRLGLDIALERQTVGQAKTFQPQIVVDHFQFARQGDAIFLTRRQRIAQGARQARHGILRLFRLRRDQRAHAVERVEQEMWVEL